MFWSSAVVLIVLIVIFGKVLTERYRALGRRHAQPLEGADPTALQHEVRALRERIAVLERVVTDTHGSIGLEREIERLRDRSQGDVR